MSRRFRVAALSAAIVIISPLLGVTPSGASSDTTPPTVQSLSVSPASVDTSTESQSLTVTASIADDLSGITTTGGGMYLSIASPSGTQSVFASVSAWNRISGTDLDGVYQATATVARYSEQGTWRVGYLSVYDAAGNRRDMSSAALAGAGLDATFDQTGAGDPSPPTVQSLSLSTSTIDTSLSAQPITVQVHVTDDMSGISASGGTTLYFMSPSGAQYAYASLSASDRISGTELDGVYQATMTVARYSEQGTWRVGYISSSDAAGNRSDVSGAVALGAAGLDASFDQTGAGDTSPPAVESLSLSVSSVNTSWSPQTISGEARITEDVSGISTSGGMFVSFTSPTAVQTISAWASSSSRISGTELDGRYQFAMTLPRYAEQGTWHLSYVYAYDAAGNSSSLTDPAAIAAAGLSTTFSVDDSTLTVAGAPNPLTASAGDGQVALNWFTPGTDGGSPVTSYTVTAASGTTVVDTMVVTGTSTSVSGLTNGTAYTFSVAATNATGTGAAATVAATPHTVPGAPTDVSAAAGDGEAYVSWSAPASDGGAAVSGYTVSAWSGSTLVVTSAASSRSMTVTGLSNGTAYTFTVKATNAAGGGASSTASEAVTPHTVPGAPTDVAATAGDGQADVSWSAPASDGGATVSGYTVSAWSASTLVDTVAATATSATVTGLRNGTPYTFTVTAANPAGLGTTSTASTAVTPLAVPSAPTDLSAVAGDAQAEVSWSAPASNGGAAISGYTVMVIAGVKTVTTVSVTATSTLVTGLVNGIEYSFRVAATNTVGTGAFSAPSAAVTPRTVAGAPSGVSAIAGDGRATVSWSAPASNGGAAISGYTLSVLSGATVVSTIAVTGTDSSVTGLTNGSAYTFKVAAINAVGTGALSAASAAVTPSAPVAPLPPTPTAPLARSGYWMVGSDGTIHSFGDVRQLGHAPVGSAQAVDLESTGTGNGYWVVEDQGHVFAFGDAAWLGNVAASQLVAGERATSLSATSSGNGYWIFTSNGRVLTFGDARFYGDMSAVSLNGPVRDSIPTASGNGYYMVASDGGIFAFGDAVFHGSLGDSRLNAPVRSIVADADGAGYWLVASDGGVFAFDARFSGSMGATTLNRPITGMARAGSGYLMVAEDGGVFDFSGTLGGFKGSLGTNPPLHPVVSVAVLQY